MNRPLFWAVLAFALGEVTYLITKGITKAGIVITVSAFCALVVIVLGKLRRQGFCIVFICCFFLGLINMFCDETPTGIDNCLKDKESQINCNVSGVVTDISNSANSKCVVVKAYKTECVNHSHRDRYKLFFLRKGIILQSRGLYKPYRKIAQNKE